MSADRQRAPICCPGEDPIYRSKIHNESHPLLTAPSDQLDVGHIPRSKRGGRQYLFFVVNGANQECLWDGHAYTSHDGHHLHAGASSLTQQGQDRPFIGQHDLCKRSRASSWFCTLVLVLVLAAALRENVASRPLAYPGVEGAHEMIFSRLGVAGSPLVLEAWPTVSESSSCVNWQDAGLHAVDTRPPGKRGGWFEPPSGTVLRSGSGLTDIIPSTNVW